ncbi:MAG TPA: HAMP domain-containing sensor histidine kinase [Burkholderiales bacterium]|nr:HAMP domain-containing sensor histidine kinase [Burkholderiales bacterium]
MRLNRRVESRRGLFLALESLSGTAALLLDDTCAVEYANAAACTLLKCEDEASLQLKWQQVALLFRLPSQPPLVPKPALHQANIPLADGMRSLSVELQPLHQDAGSGYFAIIRDPAHLDSLERELLQASECRGWAYLRESLLHELKGILNSMQISLELMSDAEAESTAIHPQYERHRRRVASLKEGLTRVDRALRLLPGAEGNGEPSIADFDASELIKEIVATLRQLARRNNVELKVDLPDGPVPARGRRRWIRQALFNIAVHRLNAMRAGGLLIIGARATDTGLVVHVHDDVAELRGPLVEESTRYFHAGRLNGGVSELQVARAIIEAHHGTLDVDTGSTGGTVVLVCLPP